MPFVIINLSNDYDPETKIRYPSFEKADAKAREILARNPGVKLCVAELLAEYKADVSVTSVAPDPVEEDDGMPEEEPEEGMA